MAKRLADFPLWTVSGGGRLTECRSRGVTLITWSFPMRVQGTCNNRTCVRRWLATCLTRFANDGAALGRNPPDGKRAADVRAHAFAEREHMPPVRQGLKRGSVAGPSPVRGFPRRTSPEASAGIGPTRTPTGWPGGPRWLSSWCVRRAGYRY